MTGQSTVGQEKVSIQGVDTTNSVVFAQNTGSNDVAVNGWLVKNSAGQTVSASEDDFAAVTLPAGGALTEVGFTPPAATGSYTVTLVTTAGGNFVSPSFTVTTAGE